MLAQHPERVTHTRLYSTQRHIKGFGYIILGVSVEICQFHNSPVSRLQFLHCFAHTDRICLLLSASLLCINYDIIARLDFSLHNLALRTELIYSCITGNIDHPGVDSAFCGLITLDIRPYFNKHLLQHVLGSLLIVYHPPHNTVQHIRVIIVQVVERITALLLQQVNQLLFRIYAYRRQWVNYITNIRANSGIREFGIRNSEFGIRNSELGNDGAY